MEEQVRVMPALQAGSLPSLPPSLLPTPNTHSFLFLPTMTIPMSRQQCRGGVPWPTRQTQGHNK